MRISRWFRRISSLLLAGMLLAAIPLPVSAVSEQRQTAQPVAARFYAGSADNTGLLTDGSIHTKAVLTGGVSLRIRSEKPFSALYLKWDILPAAYTLRWNGGSMACGENGFSHDYIRLPEAVTEAELVFADSKVLHLCEAEAFSAGAAPDTVQEWLPPLEQADILVFPTHSDDDALFFGPLIAWYIQERGLRVQTAFMVEHTWQPYRSHERLDGLWELGVRNYPILGTAPDTPTHSYDEAYWIYYSSDIPGWQTEQIRRFRPQVVVGHDLEGEYGNGGHKVNARELIRSVENAGSEDWYPASAALYGTWDTPKLYLHLYPENTIRLDVDTSLTGDRLGRSPFAVAQDAFGHHVSQQGGYLRVYKEDNPQFDCRLFGLYRTLVGADTGSDIMEHTTVS